jgi:hypothetical protein
MDGEKNDNRADKYGGLEREGNEGNKCYAVGHCYALPHFTYVLVMAHSMIT